MNRKFIVTSRNLSVKAAVALMLVGAGCRAPTQCTNLGTMSNPGEPGELVPLPNAYGYLHNGPVFSGTDFAGAPQETATEHALSLKKEIEQLGAAKAQTEQQLMELRSDLDLNQQSLTRARHELGMAHRELTAVRDELTTWRNDIVQLRGRLRLSEKRQLDELDEVVQLLAHVIEDRQAAEVASPQASDQGDSDRPGVEQPTNSRSESSQKPATSR